MRQQVKVINAISQNIILSHTCAAILATLEMVPISIVTYMMFFVLVPITISLPYSITKSTHYLHIFRIACSEIHVSTWYNGWVFIHFDLMRCSSILYWRKAEITVLGSQIWKRAVSKTQEKQPAVLRISYIHFYVIFRSSVSESTSTRYLPICDWLPSWWKNWS